MVLFSSSEQRWLVADTQCWRRIRNYCQFAQDLSLESLNSLTRSLSLWYQCHFFCYADWITLELDLSIALCKIQAMVIIIASPMQKHWKGECTLLATGSYDGQARIWSKDA
ncbi:hypothetical protein M8C21_003660, partial [Ambrosia artemisiifolia]